MIRRLLLLGCWMLAMVPAAAGAAPLRVVDDTGHVVVLDRPARRIVALSPQLLELAAAAGASRAVVGTIRGAEDVAWARRLPRVGDAFALNLEAIALLKPDLVLAWKSGTPPREVARLQALGIPVYWSQADTFATLADTVSRIGVLAGTPVQAGRWVRDFDSRLAGLRRRYAGRRPSVRVFYQLWNRPLITVGGPQLISQAITLCGGSNIFGALPVLAPTVSREAVIAADPQLIVASGPRATPWFDDWMRFPQVSAVRHHQLVALPSDALSRMGVQVLDGVEQLCAVVETARTEVRRAGPALR